MAVGLAGLILVVVTKVRTGQTVDIAFRVRKEPCRSMCVSVCLDMCSDMCSDMCLDECVGQYLDI